MTFLSKFFAMNIVVTEATHNGVEVEFDLNHVRTSLYFSNHNGFGIDGLSFNHFISDYRIRSLFGMPEFADPNKFETLAAITNFNDIRNIAQRAYVEAARDYRRAA